MFFTYLIMFVVALFILALPVIYTGEIDATTAMLLGGGTIYIVWLLVRMRSNKK